MSLISRDSMFDLDKAFEGFFAPITSSTNRALSNTFSPKVDIKDTGDSFAIIADLPGVKKEDLHVTLEDGTLSIEASSNNEYTEKEGERIIRRERFAGNFFRSFNLAANVQESDISANFQDGILTLTIPKIKEPASEKRKIKVK
ncbi:Hsp20/alpha crystallin family protein [Gammaproteobacteria bacterium]|nr:Hsp20/alpha crystallin family protein [Gammaproteobacteria bacterium]